MWTCILAVAFQLPGLALLDDVSSAMAVLPAFLSLAASCVIYVMMAGAMAVRIRPSGVAAFVAAAAVAGFLAPVGFLIPDMRVFWLEEGCSAVSMPLVAGGALSVMWGLAGCVLFERKELE